MLLGWRPEATNRTRSYERNEHFGIDALPMQTLDPRGSLVNPGSRDQELCGAALRGAQQISTAKMMETCLLKSMLN